MWARLMALATVVLGIASLGPYLGWWANLGTDRIHGLFAVLLVLTMIVMAVMRFSQTRVVTWWVAVLGVAVLIIGLGFELNWYPGNVGVIFVHLVFGLIAIALLEMSFARNKPAAA
jgi:hypothetical protein